MSEQLTIQDQHEGRNHHRVMLLGEEQVSWVRVEDYRMRVGTAVVTMGGIAAVGTADAHRMKGYSRRLLQDTVEWMQREGYHLSLLFGIADYYDRFGYATCLPEYRLRVATRDAERAGGGLQVREMTSADWSEVRGIYQQAEARRSGTVLREEDWDRRGFPQQQEGRRRTWHLLAVAPEGCALGYAACRLTDSKVEVHEVGARPDAEAQVFSALLAALAQEAISRRCAEIGFRVPADHPLAVYCRRWGCAMTCEHPRNCEGMGRILNLPELMAALEPELTRRVQACGAAAREGELALHTDLGAVRLQVARGQVQAAGSKGCEARVALPQWLLLQLLLGYRDWADALRDPLVEAHGVDPHLATALFPLGCPHLWDVDRF